LPSVPVSAAVRHPRHPTPGWDVTVATHGGKTPTIDRLGLGISGVLP
jgi:hypothetical protein